LRPDRPEQRRECEVGVAAGRRSSQDKLNGSFGHRNLKSRSRIKQAIENNKKNLERKYPRYGCPKIIHLLNTVSWKIRAGKFNLHVI
jgi:hypothetical protein